MASLSWRGVAENIPDVYTITIAGTWAGGDTVSVTIGGATLTVTLGSTVTTAHIAEALAKAFNARSREDNLSTAADEKRNTGGQVIPQFTELTASYSGSVVTLVGPDGIPCTVSTGKSSTSGTATQATVQSATGRWFWNNADNWSTGSVPVDGDDVYFDAGDVDCRYGLPAGDVQPATHNQTNDYTGRIGLPAVNRNNPNATYYEYRQQFVHYGDASPAANADCYVGGGVGAGSPMTNIRWDDVVSLGVWVTGTGRPAAGVSRYAFNLHGDAVTYGYVSSGSVSFGELSGNAMALDALVVSSGDSANGADVFIGPGTTLGATTGGGIALRGGRVVCQYPTIDSDTVVTVDRGVLELLTNSNFTTLRLTGGQTSIGSGGAGVTMTVTNLFVGDATLRSVGLDGCAFTNTSVYPKAVIDATLAPFTHTNGIDFVNCGIEDVTLRQGKNYTLTRSAI